MDIDEQIGKNVARWRRDMSQKELAARMKELGWKWSQATVWAVESGERPLRLAEAAHLASILEVGIKGEAEFTKSEQRAELRHWVWVSMDKARTLKKAADELTEARFNLAAVADSTTLDGQENAQVMSALGRPPEEVIAEWRENLYGELDRQPADYRPEAGTYLEVLHLSEEAQHEHPETS